MLVGAMWRDVGWRDVGMQMGDGVGFVTCSTEGSGVGSVVGKRLGVGVTAVRNGVGSDVTVGSGLGSEVGRRVGWVSERCDGLLDGTLAGGAEGCLSGWDVDWQVG